ncbi:MAG: hypothetical protein QM723_31345 [Myxococcaceae bacterium]
MPDGVFCGPDDCQTNSSRVCLSGSCVQRPLQPGELCFVPVLGVPGGSGYRDGRGDQARFFAVRALAVDRFDNAYVLDHGSLRRITPGGEVATLAADLEPPGQWLFVSSVDTYGNVFVVGRACFIEVNPFGVVIATVGTCLPDPFGYVAHDEPVFATRDGRVWTVSDGGVKVLDGGWEHVAAGATGNVSDLLDETATGELLFARDAAPDAGTHGFDLVKLVADGGVETVRPFVTRHDDATYWSVGPAGELLYSLPSTPGGTCDLVEEEPDGSSRVIFPSLVGSCDSLKDVSSQEIGARWLATRSRDGGVYVHEYQGRFGRIGPDAGFETLAGVRARPGYDDGYGADAGLTVKALLLPPSLEYDQLAPRLDGGVIWSDYYGQLLRASFEDSAGVQAITLPSSGGISNSLQVDPDGGYWEWLSQSSVGRAHLDNDGNPDRFDLLPDDGGVSHGLNHHQAVVMPDREMWLFSPAVPGVVHLTQSLEVDFATTSDAGIRDGPLGDAGFAAPHAPLLRANGNVAFIDGNAIRELSAGVVTTIAGSGEQGFVDGPAATARFAQPLGLAEANGVLYVADNLNFAIRTIDSSGTVRTIGRVTDRPSQIAIDPSGAVWVLVPHAMLRAR